MPNKTRNLQKETIIRNKCIKHGLTIKTFKIEKRYMLLIKWIQYNFVCLIKERSKQSTTSLPLNHEKKINTLKLKDYDRIYT